MLIRVMLLIPDDELRRRVRRVLTEPDTVVDFLRGKRHFWERAARRNFDILIAHESTMPTNSTDCVDLVRELPDRPSIILLVDEDRAERRAQLLAVGVSSVLSGSLADEVLAGAIASELDRRRSEAEQLAGMAPEPSPRLADFSSRTPAMQAFMNMARRVADTDSSILIVGETGVGKEHLARAIHLAGERHRGPFIAINCGGLPESLMEAELFGHEAGAFTGATRARRGYFELAHGGTVFLDEIGEMPSHLQVKLLRVLQDREIHRLGSERSVRVDLRIIAATNRDLPEDMQEGRFRADLYYRLSVVTMIIPPLRERKADIPVLVRKAAARLAPKVGLHHAHVDSDAMRALTRYDWPGNIRELSNLIERALLLSEDGRIGLACLPGGLSRADGESPLDSLFSQRIPEPWLARPLRALRDDLVGSMERAYLRAWLERTGGRVDQTAAAAGIRTRTLFEKMKRYRLRKEDYRSRETADPGGDRTKP